MFSANTPPGHLSKYGEIMSDPVEVASARLRLAHEMKRLIEVEHMTEARAAHHLRMSEPPELFVARLRNNILAGTPALRSWYHDLKASELSGRPQDLELDYALPPRTSDRRPCPHRRP